MLRELAGWMCVVLVYEGSFGVVLRRVRFGWCGLWGGCVFVALVGFCGFVWVLDGFGFMVDYG